MQDTREDSATPPASGGDIVLSASGIAGFLGTVVAALVALHALVQLARFATGNERLYGLVYLFGLGADGNLPTLYSTLALLLAAALLAVVALRSPAERGYWWVLCAIFVFLALDESLELHEKLILPLREALHTTGLLYYAWVVPYGIAALLFALAYLRFLRRLPAQTALFFVIAGSVFVAGAVGMEMIGGLLAEQGHVGQPAYVAAQTLEEALEMGGIVLFNYALADYISRHLGGLAIRLGTGR